jgi:hypothetical protein
MSPVGAGERAVVSVVGASVVMAAVVEVVSSTDPAQADRKRLVRRSSRIKFFVDLEFFMAGQYG